LVGGGGIVDQSQLARWADATKSPHLAARSYRSRHPVCTPPRAPNRPHKRKNPRITMGFFDSGGGIRTRDLRVMSRIDGGAVRSISLARAKSDRSDHPGSAQIGTKSGTKPERCAISSPRNGDMSRAGRGGPPSWSLGTANSSTNSPCSESRQTSSWLLLRSNPTCNITTGLLELAPRWTPWSASPGRPAFIAFRCESVQLTLRHASYQRRS
jgi:hypothetical protein